MNKFIHFFTFSLLLFCFLLSFSSKGQIINQIEGQLSPNNTIRYQIDVELEQATQAYVHFYTLIDEDTLHRYTDIHDAADNHRFTLLGLREKKDYFYEVITFDTQGQQKSETLLFQTGIIPQDCPRVKEVHIDKNLPQENRYFFANALLGNDLAYYALDQEGHIVWYELIEGYFHNSACGGFNLTKDNRIISSNCYTIEEWTFDGSKKNIFTVSDSAYVIHHDLIQNQAGNYVGVYAESQEIIKGNPSPVTVVGDGLIEVDEKGEILWQWTAFDHLNPQENVGASTYWVPIFGKNAEDWTHANSIYQQKDGTYLMSLAEKDLVLNIDPISNDIIWSIGEGGTVNKPTNWSFKYQHSFTETDDGTYLLFDNRGAGAGQSRILELALLENANRVSLIDEYLLPTSQSSPFVGSVFKHPENGNRLICTGVSFHIIEQNQSNEILIDFILTHAMYRAYYLDDFYPPSPELTFNTPLPDLLCTNSPDAINGILLEANPVGGYFRGNGVRQEEDGQYYLYPNEIDAATTTISYHYGWLQVSKTINLIDQLPISIIENEGTLTTDANLSNYQWYLNDNPIEGANTSTYLIDQEGAYTVSAERENGCRVISAAYMVDFQSISSFPVQHSLQIYPNPVHHQTFTIAAKFSLTNMPLQITIYNVNGKIIQHSQLDFSQGKAVLNAPAYSGIYFIELSNEQGQSWWGKLQCW